ncbi:GlxA family transcriptional regulator [Paracoccus zhejiangensis]|uniref:AraC family transcriptional regulator n=1 Tax=Paracoccus zhejiangensis TaxID=1077935 RepID=A0A2H5EV20_9RHOB|nr:GlxA family transcriptional regulator [Paracoccus zhejiangensis]AUH63145.1 AraC family transcriptional regulator [Paracoccus zhejiangensis]
MTTSKPRRFTFLLLERFTMLPFSGVIEALRLANRAAGKTLYEWRLVGPQGDVAHCSNGTGMVLDAGLEDLSSFGERATPRGDQVVIVCGGIDVRKEATKPVLNWLRRQERGGAIIGAVCTGAWVLAEAGLLDDRRATIHWENHDGFAEAFPDVDLYRSVFVNDGNRITAAGGTSSIDLILHLISEDHGEALVTQIADQMLHTAIRSDQDDQRLSIPTRIGVRHPRLSEVIARMEANLEEPISPAKLAADAGMSTRQLERLFRRYLNRSPKRYYMETRLARARNLLMQTQMSMIEVALASGFSSPSHFSKCYRARYGSTPYRERGTGGA